MSISRPRNHSISFVMCACKRRSNSIQRSCPSRSHVLFHADDSRQQHRRQHRVRLDPVTHASQKLFHLVENRILIADERKMIVSRKLDKLRARNSLRHEPPFFNFQTLIFACDE